jgi:hypothetical protein
MEMKGIYLGRKQQTKEQKKNTKVVIILQLGSIIRRTFATYRAVKTSRPSRYYHLLPDCTWPISRFCMELLSLSEMYE